VAIQGYRNGYIEFTVAERRVDPVSGEKVSYLAIDDEPDFSAADKAFADGNWAAAASGYIQTLRHTSRPWLRTWVMPRMTFAADRAGRFDVAASGFIELVQLDVFRALNLRPEVPPGGDPTKLQAVAAEVSRAAVNVGLSDIQKQALLTLLVDIRRAEGDLSAAHAVGQKLLQTSPTDRNAPATSRVQADVHLSLARLAVAQKDFGKAISEIESTSELYTDPTRQVRALYCLALAKDGQAGTAASPDVLKDVALAYMRVVALSRTTPQKHCIPEALLRVAEIHEQLGEPKVALTLYGDVASEYKGLQSADIARERQDRLAEKTR
jgi:tetratricopeptide (TPR) repeat protein